MPRQFHVFNSQQGQKVIFEPLQPGVIGLYVCGMTVYDLCHVGHARVMVTFDMIVRYLRFLGYTVHYIRNITDIDDKIIRRSNERNQTWQELTTEFIDAMHEDELQLGVLPPDHEPKASDHIEDMINMIGKLVTGGYAYVGESGDVLFEVDKFDGYGKLSGQQLDQLHANARKTIEDGKKDPLDFVLWKLAKPGEPSWSSPWGEGRPGWHIECSAMSTQLLGFTLDIHGGGVDLKFPHHENEIAQSECCYHGDFVRNWLHVGHVQINQVKMSKSLNNFFTVRDVLAKYHGEAVRYLLLAAHYRSPLQFSLEHLEQAHASLSRIYRVLRDIPPSKESGDRQYLDAFHQAMCDDFNTPKALAVCFEMIRYIYGQSQEDLAKASQYSADLLVMLNLLGLGHETPADYLQGSVDIDPEMIQSLIGQRKLARQNKDWQLADQLRDQLLENGVVLEDGDEDTIWRKV